VVKLSQEFIMKRGTEKHFPDNVHFNNKLYMALIKNFGVKEFTNAQAYEIQAAVVVSKREHRFNKETNHLEHRYTFGGQDIWQHDEFGEMNVRNYLCKYVKEMYLIRVRPGVYKLHEEEYENMLPQFM
jgi:hypothetical protein